MRAAKYLGMGFCEAEGIEYGPVVRTWAQIAMAAEGEAERVLMERARR